MKLNLFVVMSRSFLITSLLFNLLYLLVQSKKIFPEGRARLYIYIYTWHTVPCFLIGLCAKTADGLARISGHPLHWISHLLPFFSFKERGRKMDRTGVRGEREKGEWNTKILLEHQFNDSVLVFSVHDDERVGQQVEPPAGPPDLWNWSWARRFSVNRARRQSCL